MKSNINHIRLIIKNTILAETSIIEINIPGTEKIALAMEVNLHNKIVAWQIIRNLFPHTQLYPVIVTCWLNNRQNWEDNIIHNDLFCRSEYQYEPDYPLYQIYQNHGISGLITQVDQINIQDFLSTSPEFYGNSSLLQQQVSEKPIINDSYFQWYEPINQTLALLLLPVQNCWEILAYLHWYGAISLGSSYVMAMLKYWHEQYHIELVCHYGTMLQLTVKNQPKTLKQALQLAIEQQIIAPSTTILPGISLVDHAQTLLNANSWFLHERP